VLYIINAKLADKSGNSSPYADMAKGRDEVVIFRGDGRTQRSSQKTN
jgi:hypothetical protein